MIKRIIVIFYLLIAIEKSCTININDIISINDISIEDDDEIHSNNRSYKDTVDSEEKDLDNSLITNDSEFDNGSSESGENNTKPSEKNNFENDDGKIKETDHNYTLSDDIDSIENKEDDIIQNEEYNTLNTHTPKTDEENTADNPISKNRLENGELKEKTIDENSFNNYARSKEKYWNNAPKPDTKPPNESKDNHHATSLFSKSNSYNKKTSDNLEKDTCLTGYMTDVQNWVDENGKLMPNVEKRMAIDISMKRNVVQTLQQEMSKYRNQQRRQIKYLSLAKCDLKRVPSVFHMKDSRGRSLHATVEYLTLYGNKFMDISKAGVHYEEFINATDALQFANVAFQSSSGSTWSLGFNQRGSFSKLKELDLRRCSIQTMTKNIFKNMPELKALYLGENMISYISSHTFNGLNNLLHLDLSRNNEGLEDDRLLFETITLFHNLSSLISLDFSKTQILSRHSSIFKYLPKTLQKLSICSSGLTFLPGNTFTNTSLKYLDISRNPRILDSGKPLGGLENKLEILYAKYINLKNFNALVNFTKLKVLNLEGNELMSVPKWTAKSFLSLQIFNLDCNRIATWFETVFSDMKNLIFLSLRDNNLNMLTTHMLEDFRNISYIGISGNFIVCNCISREFYELAYRNQHRNVPLIPKMRGRPSPFFFHRGFFEFQELVSTRNNITRTLPSNFSKIDEELEFDGDFILYDYDEALYQCLMIAKATSIQLFEVNTCAQSRREIDYDVVLDKGWTKLFLLIIIPAVIFPIMIFLYVFRRNLKYFCITMRNSATLSLINKDNIVDNDTIFNYDVFVSYCNEDRLWVLDHLLPHVEKDCNVSVCLHERDFQVGLSILENIVSCMDRSRSIMLLISQRFLLSQWCQFEMHLAQHRLLETRREDLILVLLEDIPRRLRPTTLHYLMLTKTYIVWPKNESERGAFWKRLTKSILTFRVKGQENISLA